jgi:NAD-dependent dihydropyrimidine dehydrogenase PreA subunit
LEIDLLTALDGNAMTADEAYEKLGPETTNSFLERAWRRGVVRRLDDGRIAPANFHVRFESWALFEGWQDLPKAIKNRLNQWELDHYLSTHRRMVKSLKANLCRGCGVCATGCSQEAIRMEKIRESVLEPYYA